MNLFVEVKKSSVSGFGLFATKNFKIGDVIYNKTYFKIPKETMKELFSINSNESNLAIMEKVWGEDNYFMITLNVDQYINHSVDPNSYHGVAIKNINEGDEILEDYSKFDNEEWFKKFNKEMGLWSHFD